MSGSGDAKGPSGKADAHDDASAPAFVLLHGFNSEPGAGNSFNGVKALLEAEGYRVYEPRVPAITTVERRSEVLAGFLEDVLASGEATKFHIIAHSMGGLDARFLITHRGFDAHTLTLTTIGTPHFGTPFADLFRRPSRVSEDLANWFADQARGVPVDELDFPGALHDLSEFGSVSFNETTPDAPGVYYQSFGGVATLAGRRYRDSERSSCGFVILSDASVTDRVPRDMWPTHAVMTAQPGQVASDGLVPTDSHVWGEFRGCIPGDHSELVGQGSTFERTGFDFRDFYLRLAAELRELEGCAPEEVICVDSKIGAAWPTVCGCAFE